MKQPIALLSVLGLLLSAGGCFLPSAPDATGEGISVSAMLPGNDGARLFPLRAGADAVSVSVPPSRPTLLMLDSRRRSSDRLVVKVHSAPSAYRLQGHPVNPASSGQEPFELRLRRWQALEKALPATRRHLAQAPSYEVDSKEKFWVITQSDGKKATEVEVNAKATYVGEHCYVFVDDSVLEGSLDSKATQMGRKFDEVIYPTDTRLFGAPIASGVNGDPKITLLITPAVGNYGRDDTIGYFASRDLFSPQSNPQSASLAHSNRRLMLYVSSAVVSRGQEADYLGTIAHETQHLINASQRLFRAGGTHQTEDVWLDEGLSMYAMEATGYGLQGESKVVFNHAALYLRYPSYYSLTEWGLDPDGSAYGAVYLFVTYLADRFGEKIVTDMASSSLVGLSNVQAQLAARGTSLDQVFDDWSVANMLDDTGVTEDPRFQYKSINLLGTYGPRRLRGIRLDTLNVPNTGSLDFLPFSAQYFYIPSGSGGTFQFGLTGKGGQEFSGLVVAQ